MGPGTHRVVSRSRATRRHPEIERRIERDYRRACAEERVLERRLADFSARLTAVRARCVRAGVIGAENYGRSGRDSRRRTTDEAGFRSLRRGR